MRVLILPPIDLEMINGARTRTIEVYSRLPNHIQVEFSVGNGDSSGGATAFTMKMRNKEIVNSYTGKNPIKLLFYFFRNVKHARKADFIVCYSDYLSSMLYAYLVSLTSRINLVINVHHLEPILREKGFLVRRIFARARAIFCLDNKAVMDELATLYPDKNILPVTNGVDWNAYSPEEDRNQRKVDGLFVGVLSERKGKDHLLKIWKLVSDKLDHPKLTILSGITPPQTVYEVRTKSDELGIGVDVEIDGYVDERRKMESYWSSKVFIFPSTYEGFGLVIGEAMAAGVPVVLWDLPSFERFTQGAVKVPFPNIEAFADEVIKLIVDPAYRAEISRAGIEFARTGISWEHAAEVEAAALTSVAKLR